MDFISESRSKQLWKSNCQNPAHLIVLNFPQSRLHIGPPPPHSLSSSDSSPSGHSGAAGDHSGKGE